MNMPLHPPHRIVNAGLLLFASLACLLLAAPAEAAWPGKNGAIAFARTGSDSLQSASDIWIETRSGQQRRLTASPGIDETSPTFSPNGRWIAYVRREKEDADIWLMKSDGSGKRPVVDGERDELQPSFFPSGRSLVFTVFDGERDWTVYSVKTDGKGLRRQVASATFPVVSPNGRWLAYSQDGNGGGIRLRNLRNGDVRSLTTGSAQGLEFSPNGRRILFVGQRRCRASGGPLSFQILDIGLHERRPRFLRRSCSGFAGAAYSPNGKRIVFTGKTGKGRGTRFRLRMMTSGGVLVGGAPRHRTGTVEWFPSWQPLR
jgi:Tol biopolymer transport system component